MNRARRWLIVLAVLLLAFLLIAPTQKGPLGAQAHAVRPIFQSQVFGRMMHHGAGGPQTLVVGVTMEAAWDSACSVCGGVW